MPEAYKMNMPPNTGVFNNMKREVLNFVWVVILACASTVLGQANLRNIPVSSRGTAPASGARNVPVSSQQSGLIQTPNPIDTSGNDVITGNVGGGKHFRGVVPYRSTSDFLAPTGSGLLDSFRRDAIGAGAGRYTGQYQPFYSQTGTVTTTRVDVPQVVRPPTADIGLAGEKVYVPPLSREQVLTQYQASARRRVLRPMGMSAEELEQFISRKVEKARLDEEFLYSQTPREAELLRQKLEQAEEGEVKEVEKPSGIELYQRPVLKPPAGEAEKFGADKVVKGEEVKGQESKAVGVYERMKESMDKLQKELEEQKRMQQGAATVEAGEKPSERELTEGAEAEKGTGDKKVPPEGDVGGEALLSSKARGIMGEHKTFASFAKDKFNQHMRVAEQLLKEGQYYRAADTYTLASIYKPDDPLAYAGKSHALFAAGEYMSSAMFLAQALEMFPQYAALDVDITAMIGGRDVLEARAAEVEKLLEKNDSGELWFVLSYVYSQMARPLRAKETIDRAYEKMPDADAVKILREAIYEKAAGESAR
jgi:tetratricopeptide (TPR) repeat protein